MAHSLYHDELDELLALAKQVKWHAEYDSDEELNVFGTTRTSIMPEVTMAPHNPKSGPGDWVSENLDLVAPDFREAHERKKEERRRKEEQEAQPAETKKVKSDTKMGARTEVKADAETGAKTGAPPQGGEEVSW
jgi:hypothetical protein